MRQRDSADPACALGGKRKKKAKEDEVDESEVAEAREIFVRFLDVGLDVIIIMTRVTRLKDERETGRQKERERARTCISVLDARAIICLKQDFNALKPLFCRALVLTVHFVSPP